MSFFSRDLLNVVRRHGTSQNVEARQPQGPMRLTRPPSQNRNLPYARPAPKMPQISNANPFKMPLPINNKPSTSGYARPHPINHKPSTSGHAMPHPINLKPSTSGYAKPPWATSRQSSTEGTRSRPYTRPSPFINQFHAEAEVRELRRRIVAFTQGLDVNKRVFLRGLQQAVLYLKNHSNQSVAKLEKDLSNNLDVMLQKLNETNRKMFETAEEKLKQNTDQLEDSELLAILHEIRNLLQDSGSATETKEIPMETEDQQPDRDQALEEAEDSSTKILIAMEEATRRMTSQVENFESEIAKTNKMIETGMAAIEKKFKEIFEESDDDDDEAIEVKEEEDLDDGSGNELFASHFDLKDEPVDPPSPDEDGFVFRRVYRARSTSLRGAIVPSPPNRSAEISSQNRSAEISSQNRSAEISSQNRSAEISSQNRSAEISSQNRSAEISSLRNRVTRILIADVDLDMSLSD